MATVTMNPTQVKPTKVFSDDPTLQARFEAELAREMDAYRAELSSYNTKMIAQAVEDIKKNYGPTKPEDIQKLLDQEYPEFKIKIPWPGEEGYNHELIVHELPQAIEKKFYRAIKDQILPHLQDLAAISLNLLEGKAEDKIKSLLDTFEPTFDILAEGVVLVLDPRGKNEKITREWVQDHISSSRQYSILEAQMAANRLRDFFSRASLLIGGTAQTLRKTA